MSELIPVSFNKIMQSRAYTVIILAADSKQFAIYTDPQVGHNIQSHLTNELKPRPYTHDLISSIFTALNIKILQIVINNIEDTTYFARLFLEQGLGEKKQIIEIDARPSDCITLALMHNVPVFCTAHLLEKAIPVQD